MINEIEPWILSGRHRTAAGNETVCLFQTKTYESSARAVFVCYEEIPEVSGRPENRHPDCCRVCCYEGLFT